MELAMAKTKAKAESPRKRKSKKSPGVATKSKMINLNDKYKGYTFFLPGSGSGPQN